MNRQELIRKYKQVCQTLKLNPADCVLGAGGAMLMLGLREETSDLDLEVPKRTLDALLKDYPGYESYFQGRLVYQYDEDISLHYPVTVIAEITEGVCHYSAVSVLRQKEQLNRDKDQKDIQALKTYLNR